MIIAAVPAGRRLKRRVLYRSGMGILLASKSETRGLVVGVNSNID